MPCNCGGNFQINDGLVEGAVPVVGDASYFHTSASEDAEEAVIKTGAPAWSPDTGKTEDA